MMSISTQDRKHFWMSQSVIILITKHSPPVDMGNIVREGFEQFGELDPLAMARRL